MKILIIDDESRKVGRIKKIIRNIDGILEENIINVLDLNEAKTIIRQVYFDLIILDLNIPEYIGDVAYSEIAGLDFVEEIMEVDNYIMPRDIIILTEFDELINRYNKMERRIIFQIIKFDETSTEWEKILKSRIEYFQISNKRKLLVSEKYNYDVAIITAVEVESKSIKKFSNHWTTIIKNNDPTIYYHTDLNSKNKSIKIITAQQLEMGMAAASTLTSKLLHHFKPKYILMVGIAAGIGEDKNFGDIIVASDIWNYSSGKYVSDVENEDLLCLEPDPKSFSLDPMLKAKFSIDYTQVLRTIRIESGVPNTTDLKILVGPLACGSSVVANKKVVKHLIKAHSRKTCGLDMESYGVFYSAHNSYGIKANPICIKSICDFADSKKDDTYQEYSAYTSSQFAKYAIENILEY